MTEMLQIYKCEICGNIVEMLHTGIGELVCCNQPMNLFEEKTNDKGMEKHIPVIEKTDKKINIKIGSIPHPMEEKHYIEWVEIITKDGTIKKFLKPDNNPEILFNTEKDILSVRVYCNIHGLWINKEV